MTVQPPTSGSVFQKFHQLPAFIEGVTAAVIKADAPNSHERFAPVMEVGGVGGDGHFAAQHAPIVHDVIDVASGQAAEVIHDSVGATVGIGTLAAIGQDLVAMLRGFRACPGC